MVVCLSQAWNEETYVLTKYMCGGCACDAINAYLEFGRVGGQANR